MPQDAQRPGVRIVPRPRGASAGPSETVLGAPAGGRDAQVPSPPYGSVTVFWGAVASTGSSRSGGRRSGSIGLSATASSIQAHGHPRRDGRGAAHASPHAPQVAAAKASMPTCHTIGLQAHPRVPWSYERSAGGSGRSRSTSDSTNHVPTVSLSSTACGAPASSRCSSPHGAAATSRADTSRTETAVTLPEGDQPAPIRMHGTSPAGNTAFSSDPGRTLLRSQRFRFDSRSLHMTLPPFPVWRGNSNGFHLHGPRPAQTAQFRFMRAEDRRCRAANAKIAKPSAMMLAVTAISVQLGMCRRSWPRTR